MIDQTAQRTMLVPGQGLIPRGRPTIDHNEYPKMMTHPQFQPGKPSEAMKHPSGFTYHGIGTPIRFPHVLVKTPDDEAYHASLGYESQGKCDAAAFDRAVGAGQIPDQSAYKPLEYPKWVQGKLCNDRAQEDAWIAKCGGPPVEQAPALDTEVATLLDRPDMPKPIVNTAPLTKYETKTLDQLRIEDLEAKVDHLTMLLATALKEQNPSFSRTRNIETFALDPKPPYEVEYPSTFHRVAAAAEAEVNRRAPTRDDIEQGYTLAKKALAKLPTPKKAKNTRKPVVRTAQQKRDHSEAIKAGMARKRALAESKPIEQGDDAPVQ